MDDSDFEDLMRIVKKYTQTEPSTLIECQSCGVMREDEQLGTCVVCGARVCGLSDSMCTSDHACIQGRRMSRS